MLVLAAIVALGGGFAAGMAVLPGAATGGSAAASGAPTSGAPSPGRTETASGAPATAVAAGACPGLVAGPTGVQPAQAIEAGGRKRTYLLSVPDSLDPERAMPVVFVWHGDDSDGATIRDTLGLEGVAAGGAIFVYPDGVETGSGWWDLESHAAKNRDIAAFDAILDVLAKFYCVDQKRVFSTGLSSGAYFTNHLACERGDRLAAIAPQSGAGPYWPDSAYNDDGFLKCPAPPVPALVIHGNADATVPNIASRDSPDGGWQTFRHWAYWNHPAPRGSYGFDTDPTTPEPCQLAREMPAGHPVEACFIDGLGHEPWSEEASVVWNFFASIP